MQKQSFYLLKTCATFALLLFILVTSAQPKTDTAKKIKPVVTSFLGPYSVSKALASDVKRLMGVNPIVKVKDEKGVEYKVIFYEITWKKKEMSDDIKTGKPKPVFYMVGADVKSNVLPESWRTEIANGIKKGEEIAIGGIIYNDPKKRGNYKAPDILITIL
jgi:hypothetical protein